MADRLTQEKRSWNMSQIHGQDTSIEIKVRKYLFSQGYRFRKNDKRYPGKPDIVLSKYKTAIFIHGCFWHRHKECKDATTPKSNTEFWEAKFKRNVENDIKHNQDLTELGLSVIVIWECELDKKNFDATMARVVDQLEKMI